jgi:hypothetical protein
MALLTGNPSADSGMSKAIYDQLDSALSPPLQAAVDASSGDAKTTAQAALDSARDGWRKLAFAIAAGVIAHLIDNLEVRGVRTSGDIAATVAGQTATQAGVTFIQSNDGAGRVI